MKPALVIVDLLKDTFEKHPNSRIARAANAFFPTLNGWLDWFHEKGLPVIFACDSFLADDFIFQGRMRPRCMLHSARMPCKAARRTGLSAATPAGGGLTVPGHLPVPARMR